MKTTLIYIQKQQTHGTAKRTHRQPQRATKGNAKQGDIDNKKLDCWPYKRQPGADTKRPESPWSQRQAFIHWKAVALHIAQGWASRWGRGGGIHQGRCSDKADVSKLERGRGNKGGATLDWKARLTGGLGDYHINTRWLPYKHPWKFHKFHTHKRAVGVFGLFRPPAKRGWAVEQMSGQIDCSTSKIDRWAAGATWKTPIFATPKLIAAATHGGWNLQK